MLKALMADLNHHADPQKAQILQRFFKTGKGEYAEGDCFLGISVPFQRATAKKYLHSLSLGDIEDLLHSKVHEYRLTALILLVGKYDGATEIEKEQIVELYLRSTEHINNWDLVDLSADKILGAYLAGKDKAILYKLAGSDSLWERRIAIMATFHFIKKDQFKDTLAIAKLLLADPEDLIHKVLGWMLREVGKRDITVEKRFLNQHLHDLPRTSLRYAIERFPEAERQEYLHK